mmetsp:Transcript_12456/g.33316  ORF Transcript_12456/g.33316 Transcript_12456/m.33316 type:complete len:204 (+) Transcript_12456:729-1340(+)
MDNAPRERKTIRLAYGPELQERVETCRGPVEGGRAPSNQSGRERCSQRPRDCEQLTSPVVHGASLRLPSLQALRTARDELPGRCHALQPARLRLSCGANRRYVQDAWGRPALSSSAALSASICATCSATSASDRMRSVSPRVMTATSMFLLPDSTTSRRAVMVSLTGSATPSSYFFSRNSRTFFACLPVAVAFQAEYVPDGSV